MKPNIQNAYQNSAASQWNRIEMLLALYNEVIAKLEEVKVANTSGDQATEVHGKVRATAILVAIESGLEDSHAPEITSRIRQLCEYVRQCMLDGDQGSLSTAILVLSNLRDGFEGIREEATELEASGVIPPLQQTGMVNNCV